MPLPQSLVEAAEQVAQDAPIPEDQRVALQEHLSATYEEIRYTADELFLRALLKCCAALISYSDLDRYYLKIWLLRVLEKCDVNSV